MDKINKNNIEEIMKKYNNFHDSNFIKINYDIYNKTLEIILELYWEMNESGEYERSKNNLNILFENVKECAIKEIYSWDFFNTAYMNFIVQDNSDEMICFSNDEINPLFYVISEKATFSLTSR